MNYEIKMRDKFQFFTVSNELIDYYSNIDSNVCINYNESRMYIGIVLKINDKLFLAPLTSSGKEYLSTKLYKRIVFPIDQGNLGYIRLANMIPVVREEITYVSISSIADEKYKTLLINQYQFLKNDETIKKIRDKAQKIYNIKQKNNHYLNDKICDFKKLENACDIFTLGNA